MQEWARRFGFGSPTGIDVGSEQDGLVPTPGVAARDVHEGWDAEWNPGDSIQLAIGQKDVSRDAAPDGALLRDARKRRQARDAVRRLRRSRPPRRAASRRSSTGASRPTRPSPMGVDPAALQVIRDGLYSATHSTFGTSSGVFASFPVARRRQDRDRGEGRADPRVPAGPPRGPVVVVRLRAGADRGRAHSSCAR